MTCDAALVVPTLAEPLKFELAVNAKCNVSHVESFLSSLPTNLREMLIFWIVLFVYLFIL